MPSMKLAEVADPANVSKSELTASEKQELLDQAIEKRDKLADSRLEMAKMFSEKGKLEIALKRLQEIVGEFEGTVAAKKATEMLKML